MPKKICLITFLLIFILLFPQKVSAATIIINEVFVHPSSGNDEWIEIYNPDNTDLTTYFIDDDTNFTDDIGTTKKQLTTISSGPYAVFPLTSSMFNNGGDPVVLFDASGNIIDQYEYATDPGIGIAIGRSPDATGQFQFLANATQGSANSSVLPTATLTPTNIPTPTKTPTPTKVPTPTHSASSGQVKVPTATPLPPIKSGSAGQAKIPTPTAKKAAVLSDSSTKSASDSSYPTAVLKNNVSEIPIAKKLSDKKVLVKESSQNTYIVSSLILGGLFLTACGILVYWKRMNQEL